MCVTKNNVFCSAYQHNLTLLTNRLRKLSTSLSGSLFSYIISLNIIYLYSYFLIFLFSFPTVILSFKSKNKQQANSKWMLQKRRKRNSILKSKQYRTSHAKISKTIASYHVKHNQTLIENIVRPYYKTSAKINQNLHN